MALTLVTSGTTTPTVGTVSTLSTQTPASATLYVLEVDVGALQASEQVLLGIIETASSPTPLAVPLGTGTTGVTNGVAQSTANGAALSLIAAQGLSVGAHLLALGGTQTTGIAGLSDSIYSDYSVIQSANVSPYSYLQYALMGASSNDWAPQAFTPSQSVTMGGTGTVYNSLAVASLTGIFGFPYASNMNNGTTTTTIVTSGTITAGDLVFAGLLWYGSSARTASVVGSFSPLIANAANIVSGTTAQAPGICIGTQVAPSTTTYSFTPTLSGTVSGWRSFICGVPAAGGQLMAANLAQGGSNALTRRQSHPVLVNSGGSAKFALLQTIGTARAFPWKVWSL